TCLSSIWITDTAVKEYYKAHGRVEEYHELAPGKIAYYDGFIYIELSKIKPMIAMPFHPSNVYAIDELNENLPEAIEIIEQTGNKQLGNAKIKLSLRDKIKSGRLMVEQGIIAGCAGGTFDNICDAADILNGAAIGPDEFGLSVYPSSQPTFLSLVENGSAA